MTLMLGVQEKDERLESRAARINPGSTTFGSKEDLRAGTESGKSSNM